MKRLGEGEGREVESQCEEVGKGECEEIES